MPNAQNVSGQAGQTHFQLSSSNSSLNRKKLSHVWGWVSDWDSAETRSSLGRDGNKAWCQGRTCTLGSWPQLTVSILGVLGQITNPSECQTLWLKSMINNTKFLRLYKVSSLFYVKFPANAWHAVVSKQKHSWLSSSALLLLSPWRRSH